MRHLATGLACFALLAACTSAPATAEGAYSTDAILKADADLAASLALGQADTLRQSLASGPLGVVINAPAIDASGAPSVFVEQPDGSWRVPESALSTPGN